MKRLPGGGWEFSDLKTSTSRRNLDLGEQLTEILRKHLAKILEYASLPGIRLYDLPHSHGSMLREQDVNIKAINDRLSHANTSMTVNRYFHAQRSQSREGVDRLDAAMQGGEQTDDEQNVN